MQNIATPVHAGIAPQASEELKQDVIRLVTASALSLGVSQCIGIVRAVDSLAMVVFHCIKAAYYALQLKIAEFAATRTSPDDVALSETVINLCRESDPTCKYYRYQLLRSTDLLKNYSIDVCASFLALLPLVGAVTAGAFLEKTAETSIVGTTCMQRSCRAFTEYAMAPFAPIARVALYPFGYFNQSGQETSQHAFVSSENVGRPHVLFEERYAQVTYSTFPVPVERGDGLEHTIRCCYVPASGMSTNVLTAGVVDTAINSSKTMILFHGNAMFGEDMIETAAFYAEAGWNVMMVTMGGYRRSDESVSTTEASTIQDVRAVLKHLEDHGVSQIGVHGSSMGGSLAMHATQLSDRVTCAILDKTFDTAQNVAVNLVNNINHPLTNLIPTEIIGALFRKTCPAGIVVPGVMGRDGQPYRTDGLDNAKKAALFDGILITIAGQFDNMMGCNYAPEGRRYVSNLAERIHAAHLEAFGTETSIHINTWQGHDIQIIPGTANVITAAIA